MDRLLLEEWRSDNNDDDFHAWGIPLRRERDGRVFSEFRDRTDER